MLPAGKKDHSPAVGYGNAGGDIGVEEKLLNGNSVRPDHFNKLCNIASEYGHSAPAGNASLLYYKEHFTPIADSNILDTLAKLN